MEAVASASVPFQLPRRAPRVASLYAHPEILATDMSGSTTFAPSTLGGPGATTYAPPQHQTLPAELLGRPRRRTSF